MCDAERLFLEVLQVTGWPPDIRLVYADWLDEDGQHDHASEIRNQCLRIFQFHTRYLQAKAERAWERKSRTPRP